MKPKEMFVKICEQYHIDATRVHVWIATKSHRAEHLGFVTYAGCEVFSVHNALFFVSGVLFIAGLLAYLTEDVVP